MRNILGIILVSCALSTTAHAGSITLTVPDDKDAIVVQARDLYNVRTGQTLTTKQYVGALVRAGVAGELALDQQTKADAAVKAAAESARQLEVQKAAEIDAANRLQSETAWGLPATPRPTPRPTPTVPIEPSSAEQVSP